jgi:hypothetical protein
VVKTKDIESRKDVIIKLAIANDYISISKLGELVNKKFQTIDNYFKEEDISNLIENKKFDHPRVIGIKPTKYKLKSDPENLLAVFDYLETKPYQKRIMQTDYYKNLIPYIDKQAREHFHFTDSDKKFYDSPDAKILTEICYNLSPSAVNLILRANVDKKDEELFRILLAEEPPSKLLIMILTGLLMADIYEKIIDEKELFRFRT